MGEDIGPSGPCSRIVPARAYSKTRKPKAPNGSVVRRIMRQIGGLNPLQRPSSHGPGLTLAQEPDESVTLGRHHSVILKC